jgi:hypothetical protein
MMRNGRVRFWMSSTVLRVASQAASRTSLFLAIRCRLSVFLSIFLSKLYKIPLSVTLSDMLSDICFLVVRAFVYVMNRVSYSHKGL